MSNIYEALKKAEKERLGQNGEGKPDAPATPAASPEPPALAERPRFRAVPRASHNGAPALVTGDGLHTRASDEFQVLAIHLQGFAAEHGQAVIQITSAIPEEGKSFVALNLAASLARTGGHVLLVDADLRTPSLHQPFQMTPLRGLLSFLLEKADFDSCLHPTSVAGVTLVPAGGSVTAGPELFAGPRMAQFIAAARAADPTAYVLIDTPPLLVASESQIIARMVDAVALIVAANRTPRSAVERALSLLKDTPLLGIVMNRFEPPYSRKVEYGYYMANGKEDEG